MPYYIIKAIFKLIHEDNIEMSASELEDYATCEENTWWRNASSIGLKPWQKVSDEERQFPIAYTILAYERPDQVSSKLKLNSNFVILR